MTSNRNTENAHAAWHGVFSLYSFQFGNITFAIVLRLYSGSLYQVNAISWLPLFSYCNTEDGLIAVFLKVTLVTTHESFQQTLLQLRFVVASRNNAWASQQYLYDNITI